MKDVQAHGPAAAPADDVHEIARAREAVRHADVQYGGPVFWRTRGGAVHRVAAASIHPFAEPIDPHDDAWLLFTACGVADVPPDEAFVAPGAKPTCPRCAYLGGGVAGRRLRVQ